MTFTTMDKTFNELLASEIFLDKTTQERQTKMWLLSYLWASLVTQMLKNLPAMAGDLGLIPGSGRFPGEGNGYPLQYSFWKIPWTEVPNRLQPMGSQRIRHDWATNTFTFSLPCKWPKFPLFQFGQKRRLRAKKYRNVWNLGRMSWKALKIQIFPCEADRN